ncbi:MAG: hypothetical protein ABIV47_28470, partial [Roseiflexaceae bacterium]
METMAASWPIVAQRNASWYIDVGAKHLHTLGLPTRLPAANASPLRGTAHSSVHTGNNGKPMTFNPDRHHRRSIRLPDYDYSQPGAYFVTICTHQRECIFGVVEDQTLMLSVSGEIVAYCWHALSDHFLFMTLDAFVVMPNHVHGIIVIKAHCQANVGGSSGTSPKSLA